MHAHVDGLVWISNKNFFVSAQSWNESESLLRLIRKEIYGINQDVDTKNWNFEMKNS